MEQTDIAHRAASQCRALELHGNTARSNAITSTQPRYFSLTQLKVKLNVGGERKEKNQIISCKAQTLGCRPFNESAGGVLLGWYKATRAPKAGQMARLQSSPQAVHHVNILPTTQHSSSPGPTCPLHKAAPQSPMPAVPKKSSGPRCSLIEEPQLQTECCIPASASRQFGVYFKHLSEVQQKELSWPDGCGRNPCSAPRTGTASAPVPADASHSPFLLSGAPGAAAALPASPLASAANIRSSMMTYPGYL